MGEGVLEVMCISSPCTPHWSCFQTNSGVTEKEKKTPATACPLELCGIALYPGSSRFLHGEEPGYEAIRSVETWKSVDALHIC